MLLEYIHRSNFLCEILDKLYVGKAKSWFCNSLCLLYKMKHASQFLNVKVVHGFVMHIMLCFLFLLYFISFISMSAPASVLFPC